MASAKKTTKTRASQYEAILNGEGLHLNECKIIAFRFPLPIDSRLFHFDIMNEGLKPLIFDGATEKAKIVLSKPFDPQPYIRLAESYGGTYYEPSAYNDYE